MINLGYGYVCFEVLELIIVIGLIVCSGIIYFLHKRKPADYDRGGL